MGGRSGGPEGLFKEQAPVTPAQAPGETGPEEDLPGQPYGLPARIPVHPGGDESTAEIEVTVTLVTVANK